MIYYPRHVSQKAQRGTWRLSISITDVDDTKRHSLFAAI